MKQHTGFIAKIAVGLVLIGFFTWKIGPIAILHNIRLFKPEVVLILILTTLSGFILAGTGLVVLGKTISPALPFRKGIKGVLATISLAIFVPGRVGDLALPFYWKKYMRPGECMAIIFLDKLISTAWVLIFGGIGMLLIFKKIEALLIPGIIILIITVIIALIVYPGTRLLMTKIIPQSIYDLLEGSVNAFRTIARDGKRI